MATGHSPRICVVVVSLGRSKKRLSSKHAVSTVPERPAESLITRLHSTAVDYVGETDAVAMVAKWRLIF